MNRPEKSEYAAYFENYIKLVDTGSLTEILQKNKEEMMAFLASLPTDKLDFAYAEGKWTLRQVLQHVADTERVMTYRALTFGRGDTTELPGYDQDVWALHSNSLQSKAQLTHEFVTVRDATISLFNNFDEQQLLNEGVGNRNKVSVRALAYIIAGHQIHHLTILKERYL